jgi:hypothetical protein
VAVARGGGEQCNTVTGVLPCRQVVVVAAISGHRRRLEVMGDRQRSDEGASLALGSRRARLEGWSREGDGRALRLRINTIFFKNIEI